MSPHHIQPPTRTYLRGIRNPPPTLRNQTRAKPRTCPNPACVDPKIEDVDDKRVCTSCGTVISDSNIVSEIQFGESSSGAAVVQGSFVGADQSHARSMGTAFKRAGGMESREIAEANGKRTINQIAAALQISPHLAERANQIYKLAVFYNFVQGRRVRNVAAVALYMTCRQEKGNSMMLIDFSDVLNVNVFKLGRTFKDFAAKCQIDGFEQVAAENLVHRLAARLEFGRKTEKVAIDAIRLVQRMEKDWLTTGRRPAGICGACLILAARMNNFRRTVREVVYVVKVTDMTINKRLEEFKATPSSDLTVDQFRHVDLEKRQDPPAFNPQKKSKKRKRTQTVVDLEEEPGASPSVTASSGTSTHHNTRSRSSAQLATPPSSAPSTSNSTAIRRDKDGFAIPSIPIPIDPSLIAASAKALSELGSKTSKSPAKRPRGRPRKETTANPIEASQSPPPDPIAVVDLTTAVDLEIETALETEISQYLSQPVTLQHVTAYTNTLASAANLSRAKRPINNDANLSSVIIAPDEFEDDPEVRDCVLSVEEQAIKEKIWVHENRDYLREQQRKLLKAQMEERAGTVKVKKRRARRKRIGEAEDSSGASTPAEAIVNMMKRRGFSRKINYGAIRGMFEERQGRMSREGSMASQISATGEQRGEENENEAEDEENDEDDDEVEEGTEADAAANTQLEAIFQA